MKNVDGIMYEDDEAPDLKSIELVGQEDKKRYYQGLSKDSDVLKNIINYPSLAPGSSCIFLDTAELAYWSDTLNGWYVVGKGLL